MKKNKIKKNLLHDNRKGFALILVLLFTAISLMVVSTIALSLVNDARLSRQSKVLNQTYGLARTAIGEGLGEYNAKLATANTEDSFITKPIPTTGCTATGYSFFDPESPATPSALPTTEQKSKGWYGYRVCGSGSYIMGIGYYHGNKLTLKAKIDHDGDFYEVNYKITSTDLTGAPIITDYFCSSAVDSNCPPTNAENPVYKWDHSKDKLKIFQTN